MLFCDIDKYFYEKMCSMQKNMQKLHARFVIKNVSELPEIPDTVVVSLNDLDNYAFSRLTLKAIEKLLIPHHS